MRIRDIKCLIIFHFIASELSTFVCGLWMFVNGMHV